MNVFFSFLFPIFFVLIFGFVLYSIFTKKGRLASTKLFFGGGEVIKDYGWLDDLGTSVNFMVKQRIQVLKYKKGEETFFALMIKDTTFASVQMLPVKLNEKEAQKLVAILSGKN